MGLTNKGVSKDLLQNNECIEDFPFSLLSTNFIK